MRRPIIIAVALVLSAALSACEFYSLAPRPVVKAGVNLAIVDTAVVVSPDKTLEDHAASYFSGKDCFTTRVEQGRTYCVEDEPNPQSTLSCYRTLGDITCYENPDPALPKEHRVGDLGQ